MPAAPERVDIDAAIVEGASKCLRPMLMTVLTTVLGLMPLLWEAGVGADLSARTAAPVVGGLWSCMFLTLLVHPAADTFHRKMRKLNSILAGEASAGRSRSRTNSLEKRCMFTVL